MFPRVFGLTTQSLERGLLCRMAQYAAKTPIEVAMFLKENGVSGDICDVFEGGIVLLSNWYTSYYTHGQLFPTGITCDCLQSSVESIQL